MARRMLLEGVITSLRVSKGVTKICIRIEYTLVRTLGDGTKKETTFQDDQWVSLFDEHRKLFGDGELEQWKPVSVVCWKKAGVKDDWIVYGNLHYEKNSIDKKWKEKRK